ncbi:10050_t:CDS:2, partial [Entrophospora sp. SA101]
MPFVEGASIGSLENKENQNAISTKFTVVLPPRFVPNKSNKERNKNRLSSPFEAEKKSKVNEQEIVG